MDRAIKIRRLPMAYSARLLWAYPAAAFAYLVISLTLGDQAALGHDTRWLYVSGVSWLSGDSPYDIFKFQGHWIERLGTLAYGPVSFVYPPTVALITVPLSSMSWRWAHVCLTAINIAALVGIWYLTARTLRPGHLGPSSFRVERDTHNRWS